MSKDIFENLVTDITAQVLQQVQQQAQGVIAEAVNQRIDNLVNSNYISSAIQERINRAVIDYQPDFSLVDSTMQTMVADMGNNMATDLNVRINKMIGDRINDIDLTSMILGQINNKLDPSITHYPFPDKSISSASLDVTGLQISGNNVEGGVITNFGSTGIDDQATECRVTILDQGTVFENTLYTPRIEVKGGAKIDGDIEIQGQFIDTPAYQQLVSATATAAQNAITDTVLVQHQNLVFERIQNEGLDLNKVTFNGRVLVDGDRLVGVNNSQLRTVGVLQDFQSSGETLLSDTLYATSKRVGINTMDPKTALSIWDEEVEISVGKTQKGIGRIAAERESALILGSNNKDNITLRADGTTVITMLQINNMSFTTSSTPPSHSAQRGSVVFNENPTLGGPLGWVSLGDARWANFGIID